MVLLTTSVLFPLIFAVDINQSLKDIVTALAAFTGGLAALALLYAAYLFLFAGEDANMELKARRAIGAAAIGAVLALGAVTLSGTITTNIK